MNSFPSHGVLISLKGLGIYLFDQQSFKKKQRIDYVIELTHNNDQKMTG